MTAIEFSNHLSALEPSLLKYANRLRLNSDDAKDLVQDSSTKKLQIRLILS